MYTSLLTLALAASPTLALTALTALPITTTTTTLITSTTTTSSTTAYPTVSGSWTLYSDDSCSISLESTAQFEEGVCYIVSDGFQAAYYVGPPSETEGLYFYPTLDCSGEGGSASGFYLGCAKNGFTAHSVKYVSSA